MGESRKFKKVCIVGVGLIGGSIGLALKSRGLATQVVGVGRTRTNLLVAKKRGLIDQLTSDLADAVTDAELILLCGPVQAIQQHLPLIAKQAHPKALVMDAGSTKQAIVAQAQLFFRDKPLFVGAHPMAGTEQSGAGAAVSGLFNGRLCILTPTQTTPDQLTKRAVRFWKILGCRVALMDAVEHDALMARVSHLPQMVAYALMAAVVRGQDFQDIVRFSGSGLRDTTRLASSPSEMWRDICLSNRSALLKGLGEHVDQVRTIIKLIEQRSGGGLSRYFKKVAKIRKKLK